ncbi:hypothetical protein A0126_16975 (plasmid) [Exiguobacterium sp. N4-1P]|uniref:hypothetical protein n=1 Tax=Exiguobacterium sp. N4-1P TaxID=2051906 RepID=UPI000B5979F1|nr:hypothetical protein [Exiguobacterium sp. N4-1P]ASI35266.1 hypothetical protein A0126_06700 [Exiguobacterium sp. N4-1P]ASI37279.1 hypothetical protein A0126_16975 [Exiguobacterium sp. N4-1P]
MKYMRYLIYFGLIVTINYYLSMYVTVDKKLLHSLLAFVLLTGVAFLLITIEYFFNRKVHKSRD